MRFSKELKNAIETEKRNKHDLNWYKENHSRYNHLKRLADEAVKNKYAKHLGEELYEIIGIDYKEKENPKAETKKGIEKKIGPEILYVIFSFIFVIGAWFLSFNITGNVIGNLSSGALNVMGIVLVVLGIGGFWG